MTNSEVFEHVAAGRMKAEEAATALLKSDEERRRQIVSNARPGWMPALAWTIVAAILLASVDWLRRHA